MSHFIQYSFQVPYFMTANAFHFIEYTNMYFMITILFCNLIEKKSSEHKLMIKSLLTEPSSSKTIHYENQFLQNPILTKNILKRSYNMSNRHQPIRTKVVVYFLAFAKLRFADFSFPVRFLLYLFVIFCTGTCLVVSY